MNIGEILLNNFPLIATLVALAAAALLVGKNRSKFEWINETLFLAFDNAEKKGLLEGWSGAEKLQHYLSIWRRAYEDKFGTPPTDKIIDIAVKKAEELSQKEKSISQIVDEMSNPK